jgi:hypothetical protein
MLGGNNNAKDKNGHRRMWPAFRSFLPCPAEILRHAVKGRWEKRRHHRLLHASRNIVDENQSTVLVPLHKRAYPPNSEA